jgi:hypothetical protein
MISIASSGARSRGTDTVRIETTKKYSATSGINP